MRRNKVVSISALLGASLVALTACSAGTTPVAQETGDAGGAEAPAANADTVVMKAAFNQPETHPQYIVLDELGDKLMEATDGAYDIEVFPNETLGAQRETIELVQAGTIEMAYVGGPLLENFNPDFVVFNLPFVFDSPEHQSEVTNDPEIVGDLYSSLEDQGIKVLSAFHGGVRSVYNSEKPITTPADLAGMKIRVIESDTNIEMMSLMGGTGTPMGQGEVYTAIQSGVIEGGENNELIYSNLKHAEVAPYYSYTRHLMFPDYLIINPTVWEGMSAEHQEIFTELLAEARVHEAELWKEQVSEGIAAAEAAGAQFNEVDAEAFAEVIAPLTESKLTNDVTRSIYDQVRAAAE
ncbi:TRAP transporter substrate-binding protein [Cellulomonas carbonis]|uniref:C4-dicarboxylate ABC transporter substrate-binding protein n=1 Tax=Cellulomonas carbonis T26 TaxID=947969 RepID=A0A0A0BSN1_9CELL|nr:TRAP transporter substrate-binding protein [Cellulomonas carbonis]KGM10149.1 C4-dicarboxylate ABC transporter substrate-binding protein [Cellulomonas carbonis T26]GGC08583.1 C4-dicarboxylate ABC transporter substrate-binding protein [Cellulomonas carbonis]